MVCKINSSLLREEKELYKEVEFLDDIELMYMCLYKYAYGCQKLSCGICDKGERCMDI